MTYFRYSFLTELRDELGLTMTRERITLYHLLYGVIPAGGLGVGFVWGAQAHSNLKILIGSAIGIAIGIVFAWLLPRLLWNMLRLFVRKGWFLQPEPAQSVPLMTSDEFNARREALSREQLRHFLVWCLLIIAGVFGFFSLASFLDTFLDGARPAIWVEVLAVFGILAFFPGLFFLRNRTAKQLVRKHGLLCSVCGWEITGAAGLSCLPYMGRCRHCGTRLIEI
jgi:predicted MFS family arabinose efflux permease